MRVFEVIPSHPCVRALCLTHLSPHHSPHRFLHLHPVRRLLLRCSILRRVHPLPLCKEGCSLAPWLNSPLSQIASPSLLSKSAASTHRSTYIQERAVSTRTSTNSRPLWMRLKYTTQQTWDGLLHRCFLGGGKQVPSQPVLLVLRHNQAWGGPCGTWVRFQALGNRCGTFSHFQDSRNRCRKEKEIENWRVYTFLKWKRK